MASGRMFLIGKSKADSSAILRSGRGRLGQRHSSIIKGKRRSCLSQYGHRDRTRGRLRQRHCFEHGFPLIRSLRGSAQRSTSVLFSFVLSFDCGRIIHHPTIKNELRLPLELSKPQQRKVAESESR